jgi:hypothetical protein
MMRRRHFLPCAALLVALTLPALAEETGGNPVAEATAQLGGPHLTAPAPASVVPLPPPGEIELGDLLPVIANAFATGNWLLFALGLVLGALIVFFTVNGVRVFLGRYWPWLLTDRAGVVLSAVVGPLGAMVAALAANQPITSSLVVGLLSSLMASGAKSWQRKGARAPEVCTPEELANGTCKPQ